MKDVYCLQFDKHGRLVSGAGSGDKTVRVWDLYTEQCVQEIKGHRGTSSASLSEKKTNKDSQGGVFCLYFDRSCVVSGSKGEIKVWDLNTGTCMHTLEKHNSFILGIQFDDTKMVCALLMAALLFFFFALGSLKYSMLPLGEWRI